ncbi:MAG: galactose-1-phosphate uridylyltransferase [Candidatus Omnitrophota bacterium]|nr:galactose-1-phosphate uridylyltransferase [Candidatus Omnitrophota bacterium]
MAELRKDPISGRWVIIAAERSKRPGHYHVEKMTNYTKPEKCPFCEGHESMTPPEVYALRDRKSKPDTPGWKVRVVPNKYPALEVKTPFKNSSAGMFGMMTGFGAHEVIIETPDHKREAREQSIGEIQNWIYALQERVKVLYNDNRFKYALIFKNKGRSAGASLSHPHHQIIATPVTPKRVREKLEGASEYFKLKKRCIFCDMIKEEISRGDRIVCENDAFIAFCPYASRFPFEMWILPKGHCADFYDKMAVEKASSLAGILKAVLQKLSGVIGEPEYNYIVHAAPNRWAEKGHWRTIESDYHWHIELFPRLVRTAGFEWGSGFYINPTSPEDAAGFMRKVK